MREGDRDFIKVEAEKQTPIDMCGTAQVVERFTWALTSHWHLLKCIDSFTELADGEISFYQFMHSMEMERNVTPKECWCVRAESFQRPAFYFLYIILAINISSTLNNIIKIKKDTVLTGEAQSPLVFTPHLKRATKAQQVSFSKDMSYDLSQFQKRLFIVTKLNSTVCVWDLIKPARVYTEPLFFAIWDPFMK